MIHLKSKMNIVHQDMEQNWMIDIAITERETKFSFTAMKIKMCIGYDGPQDNPSYP